MKNWPTAWVAADLLGSAARRGSHMPGSGNSVMNGNRTQILVDKQTPGIDSLMVVDPSPDNFPKKSERSRMPDADVIRKNLATTLQDCGDVCRNVWESMLDSADVGSLGTGRFNPQELKTLSENSIRAQESLRICQQLLNRRMSAVGNLRATLDNITNTDPQQLVETDPQTASQHLAIVERGIATLEKLRQAQQKVG